MTTATRRGQHIEEGPFGPEIVAEIADLPEATPVRLTKADAQAMAKSITTDEVRWLVDTYYQCQEFRKASGNQVRAATETAEPSSALLWTFDQFAQTEASIRRIMEEWTELSVIGVWLKSQVGIGPVLAAGLMATFDPKKPTVGHWWRFAGLDPTMTWNKGEKRPYSAKAKLLCWKIGDSFVKVSGRDNAFYGKVYRERKAFEVQQDVDGKHEFAANMTLASKNIQEPKTKATYESGHLPAGRLDLRARRYATKLFLAALHEVSYFVTYGEMPPKPYVIEHLGHADWMGVPNVDLIPGLRDAEIKAGVRLVD
jgi:hypothetical protein